MQTTALFIALLVATTTAAVPANDVKHSQAVLALELRMTSLIRSEDRPSLRVVYCPDADAKSGLFIFTHGHQPTPAMIWLGHSGGVWRMNPDANATAWMTTLLEPASYDRWKSRSGLIDIVPEIPETEVAHRATADGIRNAMDQLADPRSDWNTEVCVVAQSAGTWAAVAKYRCAAGGGCRTGKALVRDRAELIHLDVDRSSIDACNEFLRTDAAIKLPEMAAGTVHAAVGSRGIAVWSEPATGSIARFDVKFPPALTSFSDRFAKGAPAAAGFWTVTTDAIGHVRMSTPWSTVPAVTNSTDAQLLTTIVCRDAELLLGVNAGVWFLE